MACNVRVFDMDREKVLFEGKVAPDVTVEDFVMQGFCYERYYDSLCDKASGEQVTSFVHGAADLVASRREAYPRFSGVLYVEDGVLRKSESVPTSCIECERMTLWYVPQAGCDMIPLFQPTLEELELYWCRLTHLPSELWKMKRLTKLRLRGLDNLKSIPEEIGDLSSLKELDISGCGIDGLPKTIGRLECLQKLRLFAIDAVTSIPEEIGQLTHLKELMLIGCKIEHIPRSVGQLKELEKLHLSSLKHLVSVPREVGNLHLLKELVIEFCGVERLPKSIGGLKWLRDIRLIGLKKLQLYPENVILLSRTKKLRIVQCINMFSLPSTMQAFLNLIQMHQSLTCFHWDLPDINQSIIDGFYKNGSIVEGKVSDTIEEQVFKRNKSNHDRAMHTALCLIAIKTCKRGFLHTPREMIEMIAKMLWITRCDIDAWQTKVKTVH